MQSCFLNVKEVFLQLTSDFMSKLACFQNNTTRTILKPSFNTLTNSCEIITIISCKTNIPDVYFAAFFLHLIGPSAQYIFTP